MSEENSQYTRTKVQPKDFISGWMMALIIAGTGLTLPILYLGSEIALGVGFKDALTAFIVSTIVLTVLCMITTIIGNRSRLSTYMILHFSFGRQGAKIINFIFGITLLGWFSVGLELLAIAIKDTGQQMLEINLLEWPIIVFIGILIVITTVYGIKSLERLANFAVPLLTLFLFYVVYMALKSTPSETIFAFVPEEASFTLFEAIAILVGSSILFPVLMADFSRFAYNDKHSLIAVLGITLGFPMALLFSAIPSISTAEVDIIKVMEQLDLVLPAFALLLVSTWVGSASNLYSTALTFSTVFSAGTYKLVTILCGGCGIIVALLGFSNYLFDFLNFLGILSPAISAIYILNFFWVKKQRYILNERKDWEYSALICWLLSSLIACLTYYDVFQLTHVYFLDSFLLGGLLYGLSFKLPSIYN